MTTKRSFFVFLSGVFFIAMLFSVGCNDAEGPKRFQKIPVTQSNIAFKNELPEDKDFNIINYLYYYNGGGVAIGDINRDGLQDIYFTSNLGSNKLYLNKGNFVFQDITANAGVGLRNANWKTGVTMVDINADGWLDIYVSTVSGIEGRAGKNALFINNKDNTFTDRAADFGLAQEGYGQQATFFDYDKDGDLDVYLLRTSVHSENNYRPVAIRNTRDPKSGDKLLRNDNGKFTDVSEKAGIWGGSIGYGLGIAVGDLDQNGYPDLYISNDFHEDDYLYLNNGDGTFSEKIKDAMPHTSQYSMGTDIADVNNDGLLDVMTLDMMPDEEPIRKASEGADRVDVYRMKREYGYHHQFARNALQLNRGNGRFSDIAPYANVFATDWSWGVLFADLDLDGNKDIFVSNGIYRRPNDLDFLFYISDKSIQRVVTPQNLEISRKMPQVKIPNYAFRNTGKTQFEQVSKQWGLDDLAYSNGSAYADLDNDGDLDLITNCINETAGIYRNQTLEQDQQRFLTVKLEGTGLNTQGIGAKVQVFSRQQMQVQEQNPTRGWLSSVTPLLHFGLGKNGHADSIRVIWPDGKYQTLSAPKSNQTLTLKQAEATRTWIETKATTAGFGFEDITASSGVRYIHKENEYTDFNREYLIPKMVSQEGPALATGDVNGDGIQDFYVGGASGMPKQLFFGKKEGTFGLSVQPVLAADSLYEDTDAILVDVDQDNDLDLVVATGGGMWPKGELLAQSRLYLNDGKGQFTKATGWPLVRGNAAALAAADMDGDGDTDLFVGMRSEVSAYGMKPRSYLLENTGKGIFKDVTASKAPKLAHIGMVADATWRDVKGDRKPELILVGDWMPVTIFGKNGAVWEVMDSPGLANTNGWWNALHVVDIDADGDNDLIAGNLGENSIFNSSLPLRLHMKDFDANGSPEAIMTYRRNDTEYATDRLDDLFQQLPILKQRFAASFTKAGEQPFSGLFSSEQRSGVAVQEATLLQSSVFINDGKGGFTRKALPMAAQFSPIFTIQSADLNGDGKLDLITAGNFYGVKPSVGRYDAGFGTVMSGDGKGGFTEVPNHTTGLWLTGETKAIRFIQNPNGSLTLLVARTGDALHIWRYAKH
ncbi:MAG: VCBS repeat-containing protein [Bacteroidetes Order II. Incertae sedis bacterium]|nr:VCBS repeat-containing protein [Bacteroidetes Order II. bacterium]